MCRPGAREGIGLGLSSRYRWALPHLLNLGNWPIFAISHTTRRNATYLPRSLIVILALRRIQFPCTHSSARASIRLVCACAEKYRYLCDSTLDSRTIFIAVRLHHFILPRIFASLLYTSLASVSVLLVSHLIVGRFFWSSRGHGDGRSGEVVQSEQGSAPSKPAAFTLPKFPIPSPSSPIPTICRWSGCRRPLLDQTTIWYFFPPTSHLSYHTDFQLCCVLFFHRSLTTVFLDVKVLARSNFKRQIGPPQGDTATHETPGQHPQQPHKPSETFC